MPETLLPHHPHLPGSDSRVSDHFPVSLSFGRQLAKHSRFRIPEWAARHPLFLHAARERLAGLLTSRGHPVRRLCHAKRAIRQCAIDFIKTNSVTAHSKADGITLGLSVTPQGGQVSPTPRTLPPPQVGQAQPGPSQRARQGRQRARPSLQAGADLRAKMLQRLSPHRVPARETQLPEHGQAHAAAAEPHAHAPVHRHGRLHPGPARYGPHSQASVGAHLVPAGPRPAGHRRLPVRLPQAHPHRSAQGDA